MSLRSKVLSGLWWTGGGRLLSQVLTWTVSIVLIRLLTPADYGLLAMATLFANLLTLIANAGVGPALVQAKELDETQLRRAFGVIIVLYTAFAVLQFAGAPLVARFFDEPRLVAIIQVLALQFLLLIFSVIPGSLLARKLDFKRPSIIGVAAAVCGSLVALALAVTGHGVWALVAGTMVTHVFTTIALNVVAPALYMPDFSFKGMRGMTVFGGQLTAAVALRFLYSQADVFVAGKVLGKEALGFYSVSMQLASLPVQRLSAVVNQVAFPAFAQAQHQLDAVAGYLLKGMRLLSFFAFPVLWGISSVAPELVTVLMGPKWEAAVVPLTLLPLVMPLLLLNPFMNSAFQGIGRGGIVFMNVLTAFCIMPVAFVIGSNWGLAGLSMAWIVAFPVVFFIGLERMLRIVNLRLGTVLRAAALPAFAALGMYLCVSLARSFVFANLADVPKLAALVLTGAAAYGLLTLAINRAGAEEVRDLLRRRAGR